MLALIRGAGDIASGAAMRLWRCGIDVVMTDLARPTAIRRTVAFSDAIVHGETTVEGLRAVRAENAAEAKKLLREGVLPVLADPECACREELAPDALVDAILAKRNLGTKIDDAPIVVGVGPGFTAGEDCHAVVETMRGHTLGRVIYSGSALPNTNIPGLIGGFAGERVLRAPCDGIFTAVHRIGDTVEEGETIGFVEGQPMKCTISGVLRGAGDTRFAAVTDVGCIWAMVPLGAAAAFWLGAPPVLVLAVLKCDMPLKAFFCLRRIAGGNWIRNVTR